MPQIIFEGDWDESEVRQAAIALKKSLGMGDGEGVPDSLNPPSLDFDAALSRRQRKLRDMLRHAGKKALIKTEDEDEPCDEKREDWSAYVEPLSKDAKPGTMKTTATGRYVLNRNNRWQRAETEPSSYIGSAPADAVFSFPVQDGQLGRGVYLSVLPNPTGHLRIRTRIDLAPSEMISAEEFAELERDLSIDTDLLLDGKGVKAIARSSKDGEVDLLVVRHKRDIKPLGVIAHSGTVPQGEYRFGLAKLTRYDDHLIADVEMVSNDLIDPVQAFAKSAATFQSQSPLDGMPLLRLSAAPALDRVLVKEAIARCRLDGVNLDGIEVVRVPGPPDFLPMPVRAFCLPSDSRICLCPHDPNEAIAHYCNKLGARLKRAVGAGAIMPDVALDLLTRATQLTPDWWIEMLIKRYAGAIACEQRHGVLNGGDPPPEYLRLLIGRGIEYWGSRKAVVECMAEDYRIAHDPSGLPNSITLEWDALVPGIARASQQVAARLLGGHNETAL